MIDLIEKFTITTYFTGPLIIAFLDHGEDGSFYVMVVWLHMIRVSSCKQQLVLPFRMENRIYLKPKCVQNSEQRRVLDFHHIQKYFRSQSLLLNFNSNVCKSLLSPQLKKSRI